MSVFKRLDGTTEQEFSIGLGNKKVLLISGTGDPEGFITAPASSLYHRVDGATSTGLLFVKTTSTGNIGWTQVGGGSGGSIDIYDEGVLVRSGISSLNFIGSGVTAASSAFTGRVNIYIPPLTFVSHFNTDDGTTTALVGDFPLTARNISSPSVEGVPFKLGSWSAGTSHNATSTGALSYTTTQEFSLVNNTTTTLTVTVYDADGTTPIVVHPLTLTGNTVVTLNNITITITGFTTDLTKYKCIANININMTAILPNGGRFSIKMEHLNGADGLFTKTQNDIFYDPDINKATQTGLTIVETGGSVATIFISGVEYYTTGSQFTVDIADIDYLNDRSYPTIQLELDGTEYGLPPISVTGAGITGWTNFWDDIDDSYNKINWTINQPNYFIVTSTGNVSSRLIDWVPSVWLNTTDSFIAICTYVDNSTRIYEDFRRENNRLMSDLVTPWNSTQHLNTYDSSTGLQFYNSRLVFPTIDFTSCNPNPLTQPDYTSMPGSSTGLIFYRKMWHTGINHSNGLFQLSDYNITEAEFNSKDIIIELSLDGIAWFILNDLYPGGAIGNGDGCRINESTYGLIGSVPNNNQLQFTFGTGKFTAVGTGGGWGVYIKITYKDGVVGYSKYLGVLQITNWI